MRGRTRQYLQRSSPSPLMHDLHARAFTIASITPDQPHFQHNYSFAHTQTKLGSHETKHEGEDNEHEQQDGEEEGTDHSVSYSYLTDEAASSHPLSSSFSLSLSLDMPVTKSEGSRGTAAETGARAETGEDTEAGTDTDTGSHTGEGEGSIADARMPASLHTVDLQVEVRLRKNTELFSHR